MKELGEYLKETRELNGVGLEEVANDLKLEVDDLENLEVGNTRAFNDILSLKDIIKAYSKYLGLDSEKIIDEYNDFIFEHTSKISLEDIMEASKKQKDASVASPYTKPVKRIICFDNFCINPNINWKPYAIGALIIVVVILVILTYLMIIRSNRVVINTELMRKRSEIYEFTK